MCRYNFNDSLICKRENGTRLTFAGSQSHGSLAQRPGQEPADRKRGWEEDLSKENLLKSPVSYLFKNSAVEHIRVQRRFSILANKHSSALNTLSARCSCTSPVYAIDLLEVGHLSPRLGWPARLTRAPEHRWTALDRVMQRGAAASSGD